jgi:hypothetical protein
MADREPLTEEKLKSLLSAEIRAADTFYKSSLSTTRARNMDYYNGVMNDTPAMAGRSQFVSRDVADTIGWVLPGIIRVFSASDRMAEFEPAGPGDDDGAKQATDLCNYIFWKDNPGYRILWDATHDSLLQENGIIKHWWDDTEECEYAMHSGMTDEQIALLSSEGVEVVAQTEGQPQTIMVPGPEGMTQQEVQTFDIKTKRVTMSGRVRIECIEPENFLIDKDATCIEDARFTAHRDEVTRSDLIEMGFDRDVVDNLAPWRNQLISEEGISRSEDGDTGWSSTGDESTQLIEYYECYIKADADGDGISETIRACYAGHGGTGELLDWDVWDDDSPFSDIPCEPVPHRWNARSLADETIDIQRMKTVLSRQMFDNFYANNVPMFEAEQGGIINPEMVTSPKFGGIIWRKKGAEPVIPHTVPFVGDKALMALEYLDQVIGKRTGVSRATMALDPETLQNETATANQNQRDAAYSQIELIARNQAELGWRRVFKMILRLVVKHQDRPRVIRLRDKWVEIDPRYWNANMDVTINVGLGTGSRDRDMMTLGQIQGSQIAIASIFREAGALDKAIAMIPKIVKTATEQAESSGIRNPDAYYPELNDEDVQAMTQNAQQMASQPDPKVEAQKEIEKIKGQTHVQIEAAKAHANAQIEQIRIQSDAQVESIKAQAAAYKERAQAEADLIVENSKRQTEAFIAQLEQRYQAWEFKQELAFKERQLNQAWNIAVMNNNAKERAAEVAAEAKVSDSASRPG